MLNALRQSKPWAQIRTLADQVRRPGQRLPSDELSRVLLCAGGLTELTVLCDSGGMHIDAVCDDQPLSLTLVPTAATFAPRGAKEVAFRAEPAECATHRCTREMVSMLGYGVAQTLWGPLLATATQSRSAVGGLVDVRGAELRVDLRTVPAVRECMARPGRAQLMEVVNVRSMRCGDDGIRFEVRLGVS